MLTGSFYFQSASVRQYLCALAIYLAVTLGAETSVKAQYDSMGQALDKPAQPITSDKVAPTETLKWYTGWYVASYMGANPKHPELVMVIVKNPSIQEPINMRVALVKKDLYDTLHIGDSIYLGVYAGRMPVIGVPVAGSDNLPDKGMSKYDYTAFDPIDTVGK